jgi:rhodanese-related sulfurtransferase
VDLVNGRFYLIAGLAAGAACAPLAAGDALTCPVQPVDAAAARIEPPSGEPLFTRAEAAVPEQKRTLRGLYLTATDAYEMMREMSGKVLFIDVRTRGELQFIGMPTVADAQVPFLTEATPLQWDDASSSFKLVPNPDFVAGVDKRLVQKGRARTDIVIVMCQAGARAARATDTLTRAGYATVYTVVDGFEGDPVSEGANKGLRLVNGWRNAGLPWTTRLDRTKMYDMN